MFKCLARQIFEKDPQQPNAPPSTSLVEIGPRFVLTPIRIFEGAFGGVTVYSNPGSFFYPGIKMPIPDRNTNVAEFITPTAIRRLVKQSKGDRYGKRKDAEQDNARRKALRQREEDALAVSKVFG